MNPVTPAQREQLRPLFHRIAGDLVTVLNILGGDLAKAEDLRDKAFLAAKLAYQNPLANPRGEEDMTYEEMRRAMIDHLPTRPGSFEQKFVAMLRVNTE